jgi:hypothetical protein
MPARNDVTSDLLTLIEDTFAQTAVERTLLEFLERNAGGYDADAAGSVAGTRLAAAFRRLDEQARALVKRAGPTGEATHGKA